MIVRFNNEEYRIRWQYSKNVHSMSMCSIHKVNLDTPVETLIARGTCHVSNSDKFCKETGRKLALKRAINKIADTWPLNNIQGHKDLYKFKCTIWETYRTMTRIPKWGEWKVDDIILYLVKNQSLDISHVIYVNDGDNGVLMKGPYAGYTTGYLKEIIANSLGRKIKHAE